MKLKNKKLNIHYKNLVNKNKISENNYINEINRLKNEIDEKNKEINNYKDQLQILNNNFNSYKINNIDNNEILKENEELKKTISDLQKNNYVNFKK